MTAKKTKPQGKTTSNPLSGLGPAEPGGWSYICDETKLTYKSRNPAFTFTFKREKK